MEGLRLYIIISFFIFARGIPRFEYSDSFVSTTRHHVSGIAPITAHNFIVVSFQIKQWSFRAEKTRDTNFNIGKHYQLTSNLHLQVVARTYASLTF